MTPTPELRLLRSFAAVAAHRSFTRAARTEHITQQALSQQVRLLEDLLGVELLVRSSRGVTLTPAGEVLLTETRRVDAAVRRAVERTVQTARGSLGVLRVGHTLTTASDLLPRLIAALRVDAPGLEVHAEEFRAPDIDHALLSGAAGVALLPRQEHADGLGVADVAVVPIALAVAAGAAPPGPVDLRTLRDRTFFLWPRALAPGYHDAVLEACRHAGFHPRLDTSAAGSSVWARIAAGDGIGLIAASQAGALPPTIATVALDPPPPPMRIELVWAAEAPHPSLSLVKAALATL